MATVDVYRTTPSHEVTSNDTEELQLSQEEMDVATLTASTVVPPSVIPSSGTTSLSGSGYVSTTAGGERSQHHQVVVEQDTNNSGSISGAVNGGVLITEPVLGVRMLMSSRVSERVSVCRCVYVCV